jgi:hypothetical protein
MNLDAEALRRNSERIWSELLGATPFRPEDVKDPFGLVVKFWTPEGVAAHLREKFSWSTLRLLKEFGGAPPAPSQLVDAVLAELNQLVEEGPCLNDTRLFSLVELTNEARSLLNRATEKVEKIRLKRLLLEAVCWPAIARSNGYVQNFTRLKRRAELLLVGKAIHGETDGEAHFTPADVAMETIARLADGRAVWQPEKSKFMTFAYLVMRSYIDHELNKSGNRIVESISRPSHLKDDAGPSVEDETRFSDTGGGRKECEQAAEFANVTEIFPEDSPERKFLEAVGRGKGNEMLPELAAELGGSARELRKARANVARALIQLNYFKRRSR